MEFASFAKDKKTKQISILSSNNSSSFRIDNYIIKGDNTYSYYQIMDYHGNILSEENIFEIDDNEQARKTINSLFSSFILVPFFKS